MARGALRCTRLRMRQWRSIPRSCSVAETRRPGSLRAQRKSLQVSDFRLQASGFRLQISYFRFRISDFRLQASGFRLQISYFRFQISDFGLQTSDFRLQASDFRLQASGFGLQTSESLTLGRTCSLKRTGLTDLNCGARIPLFRGFGFPVSGSKFRFPPVAFSQVPSSGFPVPSSGFPVPSSGFPVPSSEFRVPGSRFRFFFFPATGYRLLATVYQERTCDT